MGNGQNRHRRGGARTRHGPHRGGAASGDRRNTTQLIPPALVASAEANDADDEDIQTPEAASEPADSSEHAEAEHAAEPAAPVNQEVETARDAAPADDDLPDAASGEAEALEIPETPEPTETPEHRAPRGRFERFYAPGQGARVEADSQPGAATHGARFSGGRAATPHPAPQHTSHPAHTHVAAHAEDEEEAEEPTVSGPREDVRGAVGGLIDALHDLFVQDRAAASQGGASRCGICYFHFPLGELIYREEEGFYVCRGCERSLGNARVSMVRRQQRQ